MAVDQMRLQQPAVYDSLMVMQQQLERHYRDMQVRTSHPLYGQQWSRTSHPLYGQQWSRTSHPLCGQWWFRTSKPLWGQQGSRTSHPLCVRTNNNDASVVDVSFFPFLTCLSLFSPFFHLLSLLPLFLLFFPSRFFFFPTFLFFFFSFLLFFFFCARTSSSLWRTASCTYCRHVRCLIGEDLDIFERIRMWICTSFTVFVVGRLTTFSLQTRTGKRTARASVRIAVEMVNENMLTER